MSALGGLLAGMGGGAAPEEEMGGGDPEALLSQILDLMGQYLALGPDTPAAQVISDAMPAIEEASGAGAPPEEGMMGDDVAAEGGAPVMPEGEENSPMDMMPSSPPSGFDDASAMALEDMKKRKTR